MDSSSGSYRRPRKRQLLGNIKAVKKEKYNRRDKDLEKWETLDTLFSSSFEPTKIPGKLQWPGGPSIQQFFPLPSTLMRNIIMNPSSPKVCLNLSQTCKYIFEKHQVLVVANISETKICSTNFDECLKNSKKCCCKVDALKIPCKIWLTNHLHIISDSNTLSLLRPKLYRCSNIGLSLYRQHVTFEDFKFMASSAEVVSLEYVKIFHKDGSTVMLDEILKVLPKIIEFFYQNDPESLTINNSTMKNILELQNLNNLRHLSLSLYATQEVLNVNDLFNFFQKYNSTEITIAGNISIDYKLQLDELVDKIIESKCRKSLITYIGQDPEKKNSMLEWQ